MEQERKTPCGAGAPIACGREPFQTDSVCDRGDVDVHAFDGFPICLPIDPTPPDVAQPQVDFPVVPIPPPPCACVFVDVQGGGGVEDIDDVLVSTEFRALGDCCEGNYQMDIDIRIPCMPFEIEGGSDSHDVEIEMDCTASSPEGTFNLGITAEDCTINIDPKIRLKIPKTPETKIGNPTISMKGVECPEEADGSFWIDVDSGDCERTFTPHLELLVPKPTGWDTCSSWGVNIAQTADPEARKLGGTGSVELDKKYINDCEDCGIVYLCPTLNLDLPCPLPDADIKVRARLEWSGDQSASATVAEMHDDDCNFDVKDDVLELGLPCPISDVEVIPNVRWSSGVTLPSTMHRKRDDCGFEETFDLDIPVPCPLEGLEIAGAPPASDNDPYIVAEKVESQSEGDCLAKWELRIVMPDHSSSSGSDEEYCEYIAITGNLDGRNAKTEILRRDDDGKSLPVTYSSTEADAIIAEIRVEEHETDSSKVVVTVINGQGGGPAQTAQRKPAFDFGFFVAFFAAGDSQESSAFLECTSPESSSRSSSSANPSSGSSGSSGGGRSSGSPEPPPHKTDEFTAVTGVSCGDGGQIDVETTTYVVDFTAGTVTAKENPSPRGPEATNMARRLFKTAIEAVRKDPSLLAVADDPYSEEARAALARLGFYDGIAGGMDDDSAIADWRN